ncbi:hypothetical protein V8E36_000307 [Tilletia maclaganii]
MNADEDPALQFFPDGKVDLYGALGVEEKATEEEIKKAYRRLALRYHPDKVLSLNKLNTNAGTSSSSSGGAAAAAPTTAEEASRRFQQLGFAYAVLSHSARRERYDRSGRTDELGLGEDGEDFDWNEYFKTLWTGEVNKKTLDEFKKKYQGSEEEVEDIREAYEQTGGNFGKLFEHVPCSEILVDSDRFIEIVEREIKAKNLSRTKEWDRSVKDKSGRATLEKRARKEASEAEEYARELGVWDDLFGDKKGGKDQAGGSSSAKRRAAADKSEAEEVDDDGNVVAAGEDDEDIEDTEDDEDDDEDDDGDEPKGKRSAKQLRNGKASQKKTSTSGPSNGRNGKANGTEKTKDAPAEDGEGNLEGLKALMAKRNAERQNAFGSMLEKMESKARAESSRGGGGRAKGGAGAGAQRGAKKGKGESGSGGANADPAEPTEEEFAALQAKLFGNKRAGESSGGDGGGNKKRRSK